MSGTDIQECTKQECEYMIYIKKGDIGYWIQDPGAGEHRHRPNT